MPDPFNGHLKHPFSASEIKIERARKHLSELQAEVWSFITSNPARFDITSEDVPTGRAFTMVLHVNPAPQMLGAIVGDTIHNLRSALDLAACEMVRVAGQDDSKVYFPFCETAEELERMIIRKRFDRAGPDAVHLLRSLQPYRNGNAALRVIHDLDIQDKHRALIPNAVNAASPVIQLWEDDGRRNPRVIGDPCAPTDLAIVFPNGTGLDGRQLVPTLHELVQLVASIVEAFRALANRDS